MVIRCSYCNSDAVMSRSGLCLDCGNITKLNNQSSAQPNNQLSEKDSEIVSGQLVIEMQHKIFEFETDANEFAVVNDIQATLLSENIDNTSYSLEDQQQTINIETSVNEPTFVVAGAGTQTETWLLQTNSKASNFIKEQQNKSYIEFVINPESAVVGRCSYCDSDAVMSRSGLCLDCGKITELHNQSNVQPGKQLSEKDSEIVSGQMITEKLYEAPVVETDANEFAVDDSQTKVLSENVVNISNLVEDQQQALDFETSASDSVFVVDDVQGQGLLLETAVNKSDSIEEQQEIPAVETTKIEFAAVDDSQAIVLPQEVGNISDLVEDQQVLDFETPANKCASETSSDSNYIPKSLIGIKDLDPCYGSIEKSGLFVMTVPSFDFAKSILVQTVINKPYTKTALISFEERNESFNVTPEINKKLIDIYDMGNLLLSVVYIKESKHLFSKIKKDIEKKAFASVDLILIDIDQSTFVPISDDELVTILSSWQNWLIQHKKTCIWIVHGDMASGFIRSKFLNLNNMFNGLANIKFDVSEINYELLFWHLHSSIVSNILLNLQFDEVNCEISVNESNKRPIKNNLMLPGSDINRVLVVKSKEDLQEIFPREWKIFYSINELENEVLTNTIETIIIHIDSNINVNSIANKILELRKNGGASLKIILREMERCLRNVEEKFIIDAGANLIIPHGVEFLKFITIVYAIQGSYSSRNIPNRIEDIYQINLNEYGRNCLSIADFIRQATSLVDCTQRMKINSSLLKFKLNRAIPTEEITALLKIKRNGDIFTFTENYLYIFLFHCAKSEIEKTLVHLISLPIEDLFFEQESFSYVDEIKDEIRNIVENKQEQIEQEGSEKWKSVISRTLELEKISVRKPAHPHHLF